MRGTRARVRWIRRGSRGCRTLLFLRRRRSLGRSGADPPISLGCHSHRLSWDVLPPFESKLHAP